MTRAQEGVRAMGVVAQSRQRTRKTVANRPAAASRSTTYPTLTALAIRALSAVVRVGQLVLSATRLIWERSRLRDARASVSA